MLSNSTKVQNIQKLIPALDQLYQDYAHKHHFPGYCYGIVVDGSLIHTQCGGYSELKHQTPVTPQTLFRIASMTKSFTAMAILQLRDAGKLKLEDPVYLYVPEIHHQKLTEDSAEMTIQDLLLHTAGFPTDNPWGDCQLDISESELIDLMKQGISFSRATDSSYEYSNLGYALLGLIIQKISGVSYQTYVRQNILEPLAMHQAQWEYTEVPKKNLAHAYRWENDAWQEESLLHDGYFAAMGGLLVSMEDFSRYVALHQHAWPPRNAPEQGPLSRASMRAMHQSRIFSDFNSQYTLLDGTPLGLTKGYGYGLAWSCDIQGKKYVSHAGALPGFGSHWMMMPDYGIAVILFANVTYPPTQDVNIQALNTLINKCALKPAMIEPTSIVKMRYQQLMKLLPDWAAAQTADLQMSDSTIFASNFFLDQALDDRRKESQGLFAGISPILEWGTLTPENALSASFVVSGKQGSLKIRFGLSPEHSALIQELSIKPILDEQQ